MHEAIAMVGAGCRFPRGAHGLPEFWRLLCEETDAIEEVPSERWDVDRYYDADPHKRGAMYSRWGSFLDGVDRFDPAFFGIAPREAHEMDPQQRLLLEVAWEALEDAGQVPTALAGTRTAVYTGVIGMDYTLLHAHQAGLSGIGAWYASGREFSFGPGRLSHLLGLQGPSMSVNTACSSSLVAIHLACQSLRSGESDLALAGGVNLILSPELSIFLCKVRAMSRDGRCKPFDASADGIVRGEGCALVVLKRLSDALADGDDILAVIRGTAVNHDGASAGLTVPSGEAQQRLLRDALAAAGVAPADIGYVEAHGTGTPLGDPIEVSALRNVLGQDRPDSRPLFVGSLKSNFGHMDSAAGVAGLLKAALVLRHGRIPATIHIRERNPRIRWDWPVDVATALTPLPGAEDGMPRLAGVSAFGLSGTNAHVIIESAPARDDARAAEPQGPVLLPLSARADAALTDLARAYRDRLAGAAEVPALRDLAHTAGARRAHHSEHRLAVTGSSADELAARLDAFLAGRPSPGLSSGSGEAEGEPGIVLAFSGQGSQWPGMARDLLGEGGDRGAFRDTFNACDALVHELAGWSPKDEIAAPAAGSRLARTEFAQPVIFAVQVALAALWRSWGIEPAAVVGHSMGEIAAAHVAGALTLEDAARVAVHRGELLAESAGRGRMAVVELSEPDTRHALEPYAGLLWPAAANSSRTTVVSGAAEAAERLVADLAGRGTGCRLLPGDYPFHSPYMTPYQDRLADLLDGLRPGPPTVPVVTTTPGGAGDERPFDVAHWVRNIREPVRFADAVDVLLGQGHTTFLEIGPHPVLALPITHAFDDTGVEDGLVVPSLRRSVAAAETLLTSLGALYAAGAPVSWGAVPPPGGRLAKLPSYPWQRGRYWLTQEPPRTDERSSVAQPPPETPGSVEERPPVEERHEPPAARTPDAPRDRRELEELVALSAAQVLGHEPGSIRRRQGFADMGMDSVTSLELRNLLQPQVGALPTTVAFDHPTVERLTGYLWDRRADRPAEEPAAPERAVVTDPPRPAAAGPEPIAVVGVGCRFPGGGNGPDGYWNMLLSAIDAISLSPEGRFDDHSRWKGAWLKDVDHFDPRFFRIPPREAKVMDPQQRLFLEVAWEALEHAGQTPDRLTGTRTGVFVGMNSHDYAELIANAPQNVDAFYGTGNSFCSTSGRLSYFLGVHGPSLAVDTACSSSLVAVHLAVRSLRGGESDIAIVGGVNVIVRSTIHRASQAAGALAGDGRCKTFDASADGYNRGEGCGVVVLKPLSKALADGDRVLATILGSSVNQDGPSSGLTVPNGPAQEALVRDALADARVSPAEIGYVEAHGTGTPLGDPIELQALGAALSGLPGRQRITVGSVKTNMGHLEAASGIAGLIKTVLVLHRGEIPPHLHFSEPSPAIPWSELPFDVPTRAVPWPQTRRAAGVSAFGFSGTNAHVVLGRAPRQPAPPRAGRSPEDGRPYLLPLSACDEAALTAQAANYRELLTVVTGGAQPQPGGDEIATASGVPLRDLCYTASTRRAHQTHRLTVVGRTRTELAERLAAFEDGDLGLGVSTGRADGGAERKLAFVFSGHGSQWRGMARVLLRQDPAFHEAMAWCDGHLRPHIGWSVLDHLERGADTPSGPRQQELIFAVQTALARRWQSLGVRPAAMVGHSMGEVAAAQAAGVLGIEDAARLIHERAAVQERLVGTGAMGVVGLPADEAEAALAGYEDRLWVALSNSARSTVLSGDETALEEVMAGLNRRRVFSRRIDAAGAGHCPLVEPLDRELADRLSWIRPAAGDVPCYSSVTGGLLDGGAFGAAYWGRNLRDRVRFSSAVRALAGDGFDTFVEVSPHPLLLTFIEQDLRDLGVEGVLVPSLRRDSDDFIVMLDSLGTLHTHGYAVDWQRMYPAGGLLADTPAYPWQRKRYWLAGPQGGTPHGVAPRAAGAGKDGAAHPLLARRTRAAGSAGTRLFEADLDGGLLGTLPTGGLWGARLVPGAAWLEMALAAGRERFGAGPLCLEAAELPDPLLLDGAADGAGDEPATTVAQLTLTDAATEGAADTALFTVHTFPASPETGTTAAVRARGRVTAGADVAGTAAAAPPAFTGTAEELDPAEPAEVLAAAGVGLDGLRLTAAGRADATFTAEFACDPAGTGWILPPGLLEAALRTLALAAGVTPQDPPPLPRSVARLVLLRDPEGPRLTVRARLTDRSGPGVRGDISVRDADGTPVALLFGVALEPPRATPAAAGTRALLYTHRWQPCPRAAALPVPEPVDGAWWLVLADRGGVADALSAQLAARGERTVRIAPGDAAGPGGLAKLVRDSLRTPGCRGAVHLWALDLPVGAGAAALTDPAAGCAYDAVLGLARVLGAAGTARPVWYVTRGACAAGISGADVPVPETHAPLWALAGVAALEHPAAWGGLLDLDPRPVGPDAEAAALIDELTAPDGEDHIALRSGRRLVQRVARDRTAGPVLPAGPPEPGGAYLVADGASPLGLHIARWLTGRGAGRVVLTSRPEAVPGPDVDDELDRLRAAGGAELLTVPCDPADPAGLATALETACAGGLPLRGVVWLAVDWELCDTAGVGLPEITDAVRDRALGAWHLDQLLDARGAEGGLELFVAFSGIASSWGSLGAARQAPADALLAALVQRRRARGHAGLCVRWAPWDEVGRLTKESRAMLVRAGLEPLRPETAVAALDHLVASGPVEAGVCQVDWGLMLPLYQQTGWPLFHDLEPGDDTAGATAAAALLQELAALAPEERQGVLVGHVLTETAVVLGADSGDELDSAQGFFDLGMNSITALEMKVRLQRRFDCSLPNTLVFEYPNAEALAGYLAADVLGLGGQAEPPAPDGEPAADRDDDLVARFEREMAGVRALGLGRAQRTPRTDTEYRGEAEQ
ncbi:beta-ketoacyl synthase N-terminal-like domain-containing protein [Streptomyces sp. NPDC005355]|uniref:type I polyketide synthase n=1 Tax=Streptomyces sp. NPDC005355 TaxID=3157038 RepID=UPI0033A4529F